MHRYLAGLLDPFVSLLEVHKLMYFLQEVGEPLELRVLKGRYGPYLEDLRHLLRGLQGRHLTGYRGSSDAPEEPLELLPGATETARHTLARHAETRDRVERVGSLVSGFESPFGLELLATVHWVGTREQADTEEAVVERTYAWSDRKRRFTRRQITLARRVLTEHGLLGGPSSTT